VKTTRIGLVVNPSLVFRDAIITFEIYFISLTCYVLNKINRTIRDLLQKLERERERNTKINPIIKRNMVNTSIIAILAAAILAAPTEVAITTAATVYGQQPPQKDRSDNGGLAATLNDTKYVKGHTVAVNGINATTPAPSLIPTVWICTLNETAAIAPGAYLVIGCRVNALTTDRFIITNNDAELTKTAKYKLTDLGVTINETLGGEIYIWLKNDSPRVVRYGYPVGDYGVVILHFSGAQEVPARPGYDPP
jgi:hypothetical protein